MKQVFGDFELDWRGQRMRRGGSWVLIREHTADIVETLMVADGHRLSGETLWAAVAGRIEAFDGVELMRRINAANDDLRDLDVQIVVESFVVRLADMTRRVLRLQGGPPWIA